MAIISVWTPSITSTYSDWSVKSDEWLLASMLPGLLHTVAAERHKILSMLG